MKSIVSIAVLLFVTMKESFASVPSENLWTTGKIHIVLGVVLTILILILIFLFVLERKISRLEKKT